MTIQLNDKVKFLDEEGGGVVTRIIDHAMVEVTTPDGFSFPYAIRNLVKPQEDSHSKKMFTKDMSAFEEIKPKIESQGSARSNQVAETPLQVEKRLIKPEHYAAFLAFSPREQFRLIFGSIDVFLVNVSNIKMFFSVFRESENGYLNLFNGVISAFSRVHLAEIQRDDLNSWDKVVIQLILLDDKSYQLRGPVDNLIKIRGNRFFSENSYIASDFMREKSILFEVVKINDIPVLHEFNSQMDTGKGVEIIVEKSDNIKKKNLKIIDYQVGKGRAVVDIHIWKLTDDELSLSAHQKLMTQLDYFKDCLDSAIENHFEHVVFIHGVGTGRLKEEIQNYLDDREIEHKPAKMAEYGLGAIEVIIRR